MYNDFGFNMGVKLGNFGFIEPNSVEPKYITLQINMENSYSLLTYTNTINTPAIGINYIENDFLDTDTTVIKFDNPICIDMANVFLQGRFVDWQEYDNTNGTPTYEVNLVSNDEIHIKAICYDKTVLLATGQFLLTVIVFE